MSELSFIETIRKNSKSYPSVVLGPGDDCAIIQSHPLEQLITVDTLMEGSHFLLGKASPESIGHKSLAVSLSDIAAMGGVPETAFISLSIPKSGGSDLAQGIFKGIESLAKKFRVAIAGGDTNSWDGPLVVSTIVTGRPHEKGPVKRSGAQVGDKIFVTGPLGGSLDSHHLTFIPRVELAKQILDTADINSMIDLSDGLATDLKHICKESQVSASLDPETIPIRDNLGKQPRVEQLRRALIDGEDFELCFSVSEESSKRLLAQNDLSRQIVAIGTIREKSSHSLVWSDQTPILETGFEHRF